jgi:serine/threonine-protein kinase
MGAGQIAQGQLLDQGYRLEHLLGEGGMGAVWAGIHVASGMPVALKFVRPTKSSPELTQRLLREAHVAAAIDHPNVVKVLGVFELEPGQPVLVMELLRGQCLRALLARQLRLSLEQTVAAMLPVVAAVGTAHSLGIVHRDLKPENVFLADDHGALVPKVLDFGVAKLTAGEGAITASAVLTKKGAMIGTPSYMAPEQLFADPVDHRADIWALGVILYECLSGGRPLEACGHGQMRELVMSAGIAPLEAVAPHVPAQIGWVVMRMLARRLKDRLADLGPVYAALEPYAANRAMPGGPTAPSSA